MSKKEKSIVVESRATLLAALQSLNDARPDAPSNTLSLRTRCREALREMEGLLA